jgi:hypothetical protein
MNAPAYSRRLARSLCLSLAIAAPFTSPAAAQADSAYYYPRPRQVSLSGPRFGFTWLSPGIMDWAKSQNVNLKSPIITQFGWQTEHQFPTGEGVTMVTELVLLAGGLDQGLFIPSTSFVVGLRTPTGLEFGVGPNISATGAALVLAAGMMTHVGALNVPLNIAVVPTKEGVRTSFLSGFSIQPW